MLRLTHPVIYFRLVVVVLGLAIHYRFLWVPLVEIGGFITGIILQFVCACECKR